MPRHAADLEEALNKKGGLTLSQLANYDDLITDALVDRVYFWSTIRKLKAKYYPSRGVQEETVCDVLRKNVIWDKDPQAAHKRLLELSGIAKYYRGLKSEDEKEHFERHLRKYISIYLPECPFEVATTNRYTVLTAEACVKARKTIKKGETVRYLTGIQVEMTEKEEEELSSRTDFSIVLSSRRKRPSLFLGPARFANHDCDSNAKLNTNGPHGIHIVAVKEINPGDEITVTYGDDYFGIDNCECLCATCESLQRNGWDPKGPWLKDDSSDEEGDAEDEEGSCRPRSSQPPRRQENSVLGKRSRGEDTPPSESDTAGPRKKRGRPRKSDLAKASAAESASDEHTNDEKREAFLERISQRNSHSRSTTKCDRGESGSRSPEMALERIQQLLNNIADRSMGSERKATTLRANSAREDESGAGADTPMRDADVPHQKKAPFSRSNANAAGTGLLTPPYARGLSRSPERRPEKQRIPPTPKSQPDQSKLRIPTIKKERSVSSLRNVMNATASDESVDIFSIPPSPGPAEPPRRRRGRPRKYPKPDEEMTDSSTSSSSHNGDSLSSASQASSATSIETFAAGNIADSICQMLVTDAEAASAGAEVESDVHIKQEEDETVVEVAPPIPRTTRRQAQAEAARAEEAARAAKAAAKQERGRNRGPVRKSLRNSPRKALPSGSRPPAVRSIETPDPSATNDDEKFEEGYHRGPARKPGDYHLTRELLATPYHRWIECRNCDEFFVQGEAYLTRIACPRCERHSKLYGYYWPKTDKEGKGDTEERVKDHRTIHRFIDAEDERAEKKGRRTLVNLREESERVASEELAAAADEGKRLRSSPAGRRRGLRVTM